MKNEKFSILDAIGNTPLVEIVNLNRNQKVKIFGKLEGNNPGGSVKDRPAYYMLKKAEESGELTKEKTIIEPTSGNTGIALATLGVVKGYKVKLVMPECVSMERRRLIEAFGAELLLTPAKEGTDGAIKIAHRILSRNPGKYFMPNQFDNENNVLAHYETTGPEIWRDTRGKITYFVAGMGTGGTLMGAGKYLKEKIQGLKSLVLNPKKGTKSKDLKIWKNLSFLKSSIKKDWMKKLLSVMKKLLE